MDKETAIFQLAGSVYIVLFIISFAVWAFWWPGRYLVLVLAFSLIAIVLIGLIVCMVKLSIEAIKALI